MPRGAGEGRDGGADADAGALTLHQAAEHLGVHYMTAYRYVRLGLLPAVKDGATWRVQAADVTAFRATQERGRGGAAGGRRAQGGGQAAEAAPGSAAGQPAPEVGGEVGTPGEEARLAREQAPGAGGQVGTVGGVPAGVAGGQASGAGGEAVERGGPPLVARGQAPEVGGEAPARGGLMPEVGGEVAAGGGPVLEVGGEVGAVSGRAAAADGQAPHVDGEVGAHGARVPPGQGQASGGAGEVAAASREASAAQGQGPGVVGEVAAAEGEAHAGQGQAADVAEVTVPVPVPAIRGRAPAGRGRRSAPWSERLEARLMAGDAGGAWGVLEACLVAGANVESVYLDVVAPAMCSIGERWERGEIDVGIEHRASGICTRLLGRLGARFARRGRTRGTVVLGTPPGERHALPASLLADVLRVAGWDVSDLGADLPAEDLAAAAKATERLVAVGVSVTTPSCTEAAAHTIAVVRAALAVPVPILVGGHAVQDAAAAAALGADGFAQDARGVLAWLDSH